MIKCQYKLPLIFIFILSLLSQPSFAQSKEPYVRIAKIIVDSSQLQSYKSALKEGLERAIQKEPGVLSMYAVYDQDNPTHITVFETYASKEAYQWHIQTPHFKKYKTGTLSMVESLELVDVVPIAFVAKKQQ